MAFVPRFTIPDKGNPYYNTKDAGGYSDAIKGKPVCDGLNVLSNCVGWAYGRYNEIVGAGYMKYLAPVNAEQFIDYMNYREKGVTSGDKPKLGAVIVWQKGATKSGGDGAGQGAIVEQINADGSIITSESGYGVLPPFYTKTRTNSNGRWGQNNDYTFLGFIYNPAVPDVQPTPVGFKVGDIVYFGGNRHYRSECGKIGFKTTPSIAKITKISQAGPHPYHCRHCDVNGNFINGGVYGWVNACDVYKYEDYKVALDVIKGKYGNGNARRVLLTKAGYDYKIIQTIVNVICTN